MKDFGVLCCPGLHRRGFLNRERLSRIAGMVLRRCRVTASSRNLTNASLERQRGAMASKAGESSIAVAPGANLLALIEGTGVVPVLNLSTATVDSPSSGSLS